MKIKLFDSFTTEQLEMYINEFISDKEIIDIKYAESSNGYSALIMYKE